MPIGRNIPAFEADFSCLCGSVIGVKVARAIVESLAGAEVQCRKCGQLFKVTMKGAWPIDGMGPVQAAKPEMERVDSSAKVPALRLPQSGGSGEQRSEPPYVWAMRMPRMRSDKT